MTVRFRRLRSGLYQIDGYRRLTIRRGRQLGDSAVWVLWTASGCQLYVGRTLREIRDWFNTNPATLTAWKDDQ